MPSLDVWGVGAGLGIFGAISSTGGNIRGDEVTVLSSIALNIGVVEAAVLCGIILQVVSGYGHQQSASLD